MIEYHINVFIIEKKLNKDQFHNCIPNDNITFENLYYLKWKNQCYVGLKACVWQMNNLCMPMMNRRLNKMPLCVWAISGSKRANECRKPNVH